MKERIRAILKEEGLDLLEESAKPIVIAGFRIAKLVAEETDTKVDDMFIPVLEIIKPAALNLIDKIDGKEG